MLSVRQRRILAIARKRIVNREGWTKRVFAQDKFGKDVLFSSSEAERFCAIGALQKAALDAGDEDPYRVAGDICRQMGRTPEEIFDLNDGWFGHRRVLKLFNDNLAK